MYGVEARIWTRATFVGSKGSHHCATLVKWWIPRKTKYFYVFCCSTMSTIFADSLIKMRRFRRKDINGFNVVDPAVACVAGTCQRDSQIILQLRLCNRQDPSQIRNWCSFKQSPGAFNWENEVLQQQVFFYRYCVCSLSFHPGSVFHGINDGTRSQRTEADTRASQKSESVPKWPGRVNDKVWL